MDTEIITEQVVDFVRERIPPEQVGLLERFVRCYYRGTAAVDLVDRDPMDLYGAAVAHWNFASRREPATARVRAYNPRFEQHGWQSTHTIVEIVTDDMPFLVDSVAMALNDRGITNHLIIHPVIRLRRDRRGRITELLDVDAESEGVVVEAVMHFEVDRQSGQERLNSIENEVERVLGDVRAVTEDGEPMRERLHGVVEELKSNPPPLPASELAEKRAFLQWLSEGHFILLGYREYDLIEEGGEDLLRSIADSGLGVLRNPGCSALSRGFAALLPEVRKLARRPDLLVISKGNARATVHRPTHVAYVGVKRMNCAGVVTGERRFIGLYTSEVYNRPPRDIPLLRVKVANVLARAGFSASGHAGRSLVNILETLPRDELLERTEAELFETTMGILHLQERQRVRLFIHPDLFGRFFSCFVFVPRERFNTEIRQRIGRALEEFLHGTSSEFAVQIGESVLARADFVIRVPPDTCVQYDTAEIEACIAAITRSWGDDLRDALLEVNGEESGTRLFLRYGDAFGAGYRESYSPRTAVHDVEKLEAVLAGTDIAMTLYRPLEAAENVLNLKLYRPDRPIPLSDALPMLEHMGLRVIAERPSEVTPTGAGPVWIHDMSLEHGEDELDLDEVGGIFLEAFSRIWRTEVENDGFNRLVLRARLTWREVVVLRAYCKYLRQTGVTFSQAYIEQALAAHPAIVRGLIDFFRARFDPLSATAMDGAAEHMTAKIEGAVDQIPSLDEDRILRSFLGLIRATLRTNHYQQSADSSSESYLAFKLDPARVSELPEPRPAFEIFVYSPRVEGIHLRGGKVARGGIRWSDRMEDYRTEILGLMKAQMVKNAVIVPEGAKGGFITKSLPATGGGTGAAKEVIHCYSTFIRGLLDLTDNRVGDCVTSPPDVIRYDEDDPYLVVAADKGTATFSDIANAIAKENSFWLGDAFASGGSTGYDHKKMGITARGAWEAVKRHFREGGIDIQNTDFTVVGIGDMSGDVFGNGMLLSRHIKLIGAFNHQHIFLDPDPDPVRSYAERERLFHEPRSSWLDYDREALSTGGGVYPRAAKSIVLSSQVREALGVTAKAMPPNEVVRALLKAPADLLWSAGIGTFVRASNESDAEVGDKTNDAIRVSAAELRCRVVGEGGNLGLTQPGRVEFALQGGRINTDAIDNSGGVDCSDHEVNIKILLDRLVAEGDLTEKQRNRLLVEMTEEVAGLVLTDNYLQTQALSASAAQAAALLDVHWRLLRSLEREGKLEPALESLPDKDGFTERKSAGIGLTSPELSVLLAHSKIKLVQGLLQSDIASDMFLARELTNSFPRPICERFPTPVSVHPLRKEIICTQLANNIVNRAGLSFVFLLQEETGAAAADIARAYLVVREVFALEELWEAIEELDNRLPSEVQTEMLNKGQVLLYRATRWLLLNRPHSSDVAATAAYFAAGVRELSETIAENGVGAHRGDWNERTKAYTDAGVPEALARRVESLDPLSAAFDMVEIGAATGAALPEVAKAYFLLGARLELGWLQDQILTLPRDNRWQALAQASLRDDLFSQWRLLTTASLQPPSLGEVFDAGSAQEYASRVDSEALVERWMACNEAALARCFHLLADLKSGPTPDFAMLSVAMREIRALRPVECPTVVQPVAESRGT